MSFNRKEWEFGSELVVRQGEAGSACPQVCIALPQVLESDPRRDDAGGAWLEIVLHRECSVLSSYPDVEGSIRRCTVVFERILHDRLQGQRRYVQVKLIGPDVDLYLDRVRETDRLQVEIRSGEFQFPPEFHDWEIDDLQDVAVNGGELIDKMLCTPGILPDERREDVQAVEQEVRIQLGLEYGEADVRILPLQHFRPAPLV